MVRIGDDLENKMVVDWAWGNESASAKTCECDVCGKRYEPRSRFDWDWICLDCAEKARNHAVEILRKNLSGDEMSVIEDLWEIYAGV